MSRMPKPQEIYRHFKGNLYRIVTLAQHSETGEQLVVYQALYGDYQVYARPLSMFLERVDRSKYPDAAQEYRFELQQELISTSSKEQEPEQLQTAAEERGPEQDGLGAVQEDQEALNIDPLVLKFLDADTYEERLNILAALRHRVTDDMLNIMSMALDIELGEGGVEERYEEFKNCLLTFEKYESNRLR